MHISFLGNIPHVQHCTLFCFACCTMVTFYYAVLLRGMSYSCLMVNAFFGEPFDKLGAEEFATCVRAECANVVVCLAFQFANQ
jgi:hypothetical protein